MVLTTRIYRVHPHIPPAEFACEQRGQMIGSSFARGIAGEIDIRTVVHASTATGDDDDSTADVSTFDAFAHVKIASCVQKLQTGHGEKVMRRRVDAKGLRPCGAFMRPHGLL